MKDDDMLSPVRLRFDASMYDFKPAPSGKRKESLPPIILNNKQDPIHWFDRSGNYIAMFKGLDGKTYMAVAEPKDWPPEIWDLYESEGITLVGPTPIEEINYPSREEYIK